MHTCWFLQRYFSLPRGFKYILLFYLELLFFLRNTLAEEKKRLETAMIHRAEELEEAQTAREEAEDRYKRTLSQMEQIQVELGLERNNTGRLEAQKTTLEKQIKELREKLAEQERESGKRLKLQVSALEERVAAAEEQLENENKERQNAIRNARRLDKRLKEVLLQARNILLLHIGDFLSRISHWPIPWSTPYMAMITHYPVALGTMDRVANLLLRLLFVAAETVKPCQEVGGGLLE